MESAVPKPFLFSIDRLIRDVTDIPRQLARIGVRTPISDLNPFATQSPLRREYCTGIFIAPDLILAPAFLFRNRKVRGYPITVQPATEDLWREIPFDAADLEIIADPELTDPAATIVLMRFDVGPSLGAVALSFEVPQQDDPVIVAQFSGALPEASISFGRMKAISEHWHDYDAATLPGSSGSPVFDTSWRVVAMHMLSKDGYSRGLNRATILRLLRRSRSWPEIAAHHRIADFEPSPVETVRSIAAPPDRLRLRLALTSSFDPGALSEAERADLSAHVADVQAPRWSLTLEARRETIAAAAQAGILRTPHEPDRTSALGRVVTAILAGPPHNPDDFSYEELGWWLQAVRWFAGSITDLPAAATIATVLARRRIRERLTATAGESLRGRDPILAGINRWFAAKAGPIMLHGVGGIGKSALMARFALSLPSGTLLLWLDFDRADLAPDDAVSIMRAIAEQVVAQVPDLPRPDFTPEGWATETASFGAKLARQLGDQPALLVLDSFEAAQYAIRFQEIWDVLDRFAGAMPSLRVCVTGRATVPDLALAGRPATSLPLPGLDKGDVHAWLGENAIRGPAADAVIALSRGTPLIIQLALRYVAAGGDIAGIPQNLPDMIVSGYLHERILDRVQDARIRPLASGVLVLRRVTADMLEPLFRGVVDLPPGSPTDWFGELAREMSLVEGGEVLVVRPEIRSATLALLEQDDPGMVHAIDARAAAWLAGRSAHDLPSRAELVYHLLRGGDRAAAAAAWQDGCEALLAQAADDLRDPAARAWLERRLGTLDLAQASQDAWERDAAERIRVARRRGLDRAVGPILRERAERQSDSPLLFQDAFETYRSGNEARALAMTDGAGITGGKPQRDLLVLRAALLARLDNRDGADDLLRSVEASCDWNDHGSDSETLALLVRASRIATACDPLAEHELITVLDHKNTLLPRPEHMTMPRLAQILRSRYWKNQSDVAPLDIASADFPAALRLQITRGLGPTYQGGPGLEIAYSDAWDRIEEGSSPKSAWPEMHQPGYAIVEFGYRRWLLATQTDFLPRSFSAVLDDRAAPTPVRQALLGILGLFVRPADELFLTIGGAYTAQRLLATALIRTEIVLPETRAWTAQRLLKTGVDPEHDWLQYFRPFGSYRQSVSPYDLMNNGYPDPSLLWMVCPEPLEALIDHLAGVRMRSET